ncbi:MAG: SH3 domain-containing protein [Treponema sp.]|nr:SH3 domain-containing protein [Treponema sp.]
MECIFSLVIPDAKPSDVQVDTPNLPPQVNFISMRRTDYHEYGVQGGTKIDVWLLFRTPDVYQLPPLRVRIKRSMHEIPFAAVTVLQNPDATTPRLIILFENGIEVADNILYDDSLFSVHVGNTVRFMLYVQYAVQIIQFTWSVPRDALFTEVQRFEITEGKPRASDFSSTLIPLALFEWQPLVPGEATIPDIQLTATAYSGKRERLSQAAARITVLAATDSSNSAHMMHENYFSYAFTEVVAPQDEPERIVLSESDCAALAAFRIKERHSLIPLRAANERRAFEKSLGIASGQTEPNIWTFVLFVSIACILLVFAIVMFAVKKRIVGVILFSCVCVVLMPAIVAGIQLSNRYGIFKGGVIRSVPDESSGVVSPIESGERVKVEEEAGAWIYIQYGNTGGWILSDAVILIK